MKEIYIRELESKKKEESIRRGRRRPEEDGGTEYRISWKDLSARLELNAY